MQSLSPGGGTIFNPRVLSLFSRAPGEPGVNRICSEAFKLSEPCEGPPAARKARAQNVRPCSFLSFGALLDQWLIPAIFALESIARPEHDTGDVRAAL
jgi:hypothetical protein